MKNLESLGRSLSKEEQKRIMGGDGNKSLPTCNAGKVCYNLALNTNGICLPSGDQCLCVKLGIGAFAPECDGMA